MCDKHICCTKTVHKYVSYMSYQSSLEICYQHLWPQVQHNHASDLTKVTRSGQRPLTHGSSVHKNFLLIDGFTLVFARLNTKQPPHRPNTKNNDLQTDQLKILP